MVTAAGIPSPRVNRPKEKGLLVSPKIGRNINYHSINNTNSKDASGDYIVNLDTSLVPDMDEHKTTYGQTVVHLIKGYIGCGILSLPWAVSQLGIIPGVIGVLIMAFWSSYNCWTVVKLKRFIERTENMVDDDASEDSGISASTGITYPDVGHWAHGIDFQRYVSVCIVTQQLAICTVFLSFVGENLLAVMEFCDVHFIQTHGAVISLVLPAALMLSFLPSLRALSPVMMIASLLLFTGFSSLAVIGCIEWGTRPLGALPTWETTKAPIALCGILYSFEGICLILPVESSMKEPKGFKSAFILSMSAVAIIMCLMAVLSILAFGEVTNGSITAFLLTTFKEDAQAKFWLMTANLLVSLSILCTYPLMLFPAVELVGPALAHYQQDKELEEEQSLSGFEPMQALPEHEEASLGSIPSMKSDYEFKSAVACKEGAAVDDDDEKHSVSHLSSMGQSILEMLPEMQMVGDSPQLRVGLVMITYTFAMLVPNVESLVSLAGAIAGSSTALLIPPILELAWIRHLEREGTQIEREQVDDQSWFVLAYRNKYFWEKVKSWVLLLSGLLFAAFGTYASVKDIVNIYMTQDAS